MSILSNFTAYVKQVWANRPTLTSPLSAARLNHMEAGIKANSDAVEALSKAVLSNIINDPDKIASMAALFAVNQSVAANAAAITKLNSEMNNFTTLPDDVGFNEITTPGFYSVYTNVDAPSSQNKNRWIVRVEELTENNIPYYIQTAYFYMGGEWVSPKIRHTYYDVTSVLVWSQWV